MKKGIKVFSTLFLFVLTALFLVSCVKDDKPKEIDLSKVNVTITGFASGDSIEGVTKDFDLPVNFDDGVTATWESNNEAIVVTGSKAKVTRSTEQDVLVNLTPTLKVDVEGEDPKTLKRDPIEVKVLKLDLSPTATGKVYHWLPDSVGVGVTFTLELNGVDADDVTVKLEETDLIEGLEYEIVDNVLELFGDFLIEDSNELGEYELTIITEYGQTKVSYFVVDNPTDTSIETEEKLFQDMGALTQATITEPIANAPELLITEVAADAGKYSYVEVFNNSNKQRNLKGHMLTFNNVDLAWNQTSISENNGLFTLPFTAVPFLIDEDFVLAPFETGIIWYVYGGNDVPYIFAKGSPAYSEVTLAENAATWLFDWQGGTLKETDFRAAHGIDENVKVIAVRGSQVTVNNTTAHDDNGYGLPVRRANGFGGVNSSVANRAVQIQYFDPELQHEIPQGDTDAPEGAAYFKMSLEIHNKERDFVKQDGTMDLENLPALGGRKSINTFIMRRVYYNSSNELVGYDKKWNFAADSGTGAYGLKTYMNVAETAILSTALFFPGLLINEENETEEFRWGTGHGMEYTLPEAGSHVMRFVPRNADVDYLAFIDAKYTKPISNALYKKGLSPVINDIAAGVQAVQVPINPAYVYEVPVKENSAGVTSKYNLGLN